VVAQRDASNRAHFYEGHSLLLLGVLHIVVVALAPLLLWETRPLLRSVLLAWVGFQLLLALFSFLGVVCQRRGQLDRFRQMSNLERIGALISFLSLPWLGTGMAAATPGKYITMMTFLAITAIAGSNSSHITRWRPAFDRNLVIVGVSYGGAFAVQGEWVLVLLVAVWSVTVAALTRLAYQGTVEILAMREASEQSARHDDLTGLLSRSAFLEDLAVADGQSQALVLFDLDGFKAINDAFGHPAGDAVLRAVADRLTSNLPEGSSIARIGGDEFAARLDGSNGGISGDVERALSAVADPIVFDGREIYVAASAGWTSMPTNGTPAELMAQADAAMYESKKSETSWSTSFDTGLRQELDRSLEMRQRFRAGLRQQEIEFWAQPLVRTSDGRPVAIEVLARWRQSDGTYVSPGEFTRVADQTGLAVELDRQALAAAEKTLAAWHGHPVLDAITVKINISPVHLHNQGLIQSVQQLVPQRYRNRLGLEFVESRLIAAAERNHDQMRKLLDMGITLSIDDFGVGYSSLAYLRTLPVSELKIDRSFITNVDTDRVNQGLVRAIVDIASALDLPTVAEGIENDAELAEVARLGVTVGQGYHMGHPVPLDDAGALIKKMHASVADLH